MEYEQEKIVSSHNINFKNVNIEYKKLLSNLVKGIEKKNVFIEYK